jgi:hypothetical protein
MFYVHQDVDKLIFIVFEKKKKITIDPRQYAGQIASRCCNFMDEPNWYLVPVDPYLQACEAAREFPMTASQL